MTDNIISYIDMCRREGASLQAGMNFGLGFRHSVILMSVRNNAPYRDRLEGGGTTLIYEGHDQPRSADCTNPKTVDQPLVTHTGRQTKNGKFFEAAKDAVAGKRSRRHALHFLPILPRETSVHRSSKKFISLCP